MDFVVWLMRYIKVQLTTAKLLVGGAIPAKYVRYYIYYTNRYYNIIIPLPRALEWAPFHPVREQGLPERDYPRWPKDVEKSVETSV